MITAGGETHCVVAFPTIEDRAVGQRNVQSARYIVGRGRSLIRAVAVVSDYGARRRAGKGRRIVVRDRKARGGQNVVHQTCHRGGIILRRVVVDKEMERPVWCITGHNQGVLRAIDASLDIADRVAVEARGQAGSRRGMVERTGL